uniref:Uncharacterized protein n=1 Tax=Caenorhabditis japonica TaxID=281687 RepID=A0A8R1ESW3_CAEJA
MSKRDHYTLQDLFVHKAINVASDAVKRSNPMAAKAGPYLLTCDTCEVRPQFPSWILRTKLRQVTRSLPTVDHARLASSMPILRRPCPRLPLRASLWMKILIESLMSSAHLFGGRPRGRADPLGSHSDTIFAHLSYFMRDTCPAHFSFLRKTCFSMSGGSHPAISNMLLTALCSLFVSASLEVHVSHP